MRKMASIRVIDNISPIPNADAIEVARIGGWNVVVKKGEYSLGDLVVFCEIDSWIPHELAPFLTKSGEPRVYNGVPGARLRTVKLRGQISQGLILPITHVRGQMDVSIGDDVSQILNIQKWEMEVPRQLAGLAKGNFPSFLIKTDQERVQNLVGIIPAGTYEVTEKLDGSSMTAYLNDGVFGVCSRNLELKETEDNAFWFAARNQNLQLLLSIMRDITGFNVAIQGELLGPKIQGNRYGLREPRIFIFDIFNIDAGVYVDPLMRISLVANAIERMSVILGVSEISDIDWHAWVVPTSKFVDVQDSDEYTVKGMIEQADVISNLASVTQEGYVYRNIKNQFSFKVISNKFLMSGGE
jgi:RNA ligase (TIGR02306 family)